MVRRALAGPTEAIGLIKLVAIRLFDRGVLREFGVCLLGRVSEAEVREEGGEKCFQF